MPQLSRKLIGVALTDQLNQVGIHLNTHQFIRQLIVNHGAENVDVTTWNAIVSSPAPRTMGIRGGSGEFHWLCFIGQFDVDHTLQQVVMFSLYNTMAIALCQNLKSTLKLFGCYNWLPLTAYRLGRNFRFVTHNPPGIEPVVEDVRKRVLVGFAFSIGLNLHEWTTTAIMIATSMQFFTDFIQSHAICEQQIPCQSPDMDAFRVMFNPAHILAMLGFCIRLCLLLTVNISVG